ncbi:MAG: hypothetical protein GQ527_06620 [Bacteroidales bacterium]|nr:hypothetical protein [Bacteroidales bacterium]
MKRNNYSTKYKELREKHPQFFYHDFNYHFKESNCEIVFHFSIGDEFHFYPKHSIQIASNLN